MILQGVDEETCRKCRKQQLRQGKTPPCSTACLVTFRPKVRLTFREYEIMNKLMDFCNTGELHESNPQVREMIIAFRQRAFRYMRMVEDLKKKKRNG
jgi:hypothetical protein